MNSLSDYLDGPVAGKGTAAPVFLEATVAENADKEHPGMVRVTYTVFADGKNRSAWVPVLSPYAGKDYGVFMVPEIGDVVVVAFLNRDMQRPFIIGSFYPQGATLPGDSFDENNRIRALRTKGGIGLLLRDEPEKQAVELTTPGGLTVELSDEAKTLRLSDKDKKNSMALDAGNNAVTLQCDGKLTLKAGSCELVLDGQSGKMTVKAAQIELKADQSAALSAGTTLTLEGAVAKLEGKQTASLKGSGMTEVSGGILKLN
jgi:uncharacterized protein involved in type VI secretion and phage assembly